MGSYRKLTRPVWDPTRSLHALYGILYRACTACVGSCAKPARLVWDLLQCLHVPYGNLWGQSHDPREGCAEMMIR
eukprot:3589443-Pyramimonas_sp.AAC.1